MKKDYITPEVKIKLIDFRDILTDSQHEHEANGGDEYGAKDDPGNFIK